MLPSPSLRISAAFRRSTSWIILLSVSAALLFASAAVPARADVPDPPPTDPFTAPLCEGTTTADPTDGDPDRGIEDLTRVWGQRLVDYNAGRLVHLYGPDGTNGGVPSCTTRYVDGAGAVSEWTYCTDHSLGPCNTTIGDGSLGSIPPLEHVDDNVRLTAEQERVIAYIVQTDLPIVSTTGGTSTASDDTGPHRSNRQLLVWCVSDPEDVAEMRPGWCDLNMDAAEQDRMLALSAAESVLTFALEAGSTDLDAGETARVDITTNVYRQPIALTVDTDADEPVIAVCEGAATYDDGVIIVNGDDAATPSTVTLCITSDEAGVVTVAGSASPTTREHVSWVQSDTRCQVFATFETARVSAIESAVTVRFRAVEPVTGGFSIVKTVLGDASAAVSGDVEFTVAYTIDGETRELTLEAGGPAAEVSGLPAGSIVALEEIDLPSIDGLEWGEPSFTIDGSPVSSVVIGPDATVDVVLTNTATSTADTPTPTPTPMPSTPAPVPTTPAPTTDDDLAGTGGTPPWTVALIGAILATTGLMMAIARARRAGQRVRG